MLKDIDDLALVARASALAPDLDHDDGDDGGYWTVIGELHRRGTRLIFDEAARLSRDEDPRARRVACDVLGQLGYEHGRPFGAETFPLLARIGTDDASPPVVASAISAMGHLGRPEALPFVVAHAEHADPDVRFSVAWALPSIAGVKWLDPMHPAVTTLMQLTTDVDADVRDWATFGLGSQVVVDGAAVRRCLLARVDDPDEDTRAEAIAGLARRHAPETARVLRDALGGDTVSPLTVESACSLGDPSLAEPLAQLATWWDVDVDLLEDARRRCAPTRIDEEATFVGALLGAAELSRISVSVSSELLSIGAGEPVVSVVGAGIDVLYAMEALMRRADGSVETAVGLIRHDLDEVSVRR